MGQSTEQSHAHPAPPGSRGLAHDLWHTKCWRLFPLLTTYVVSLTFLMPVKPDLMTDFFASRHSSHVVHCERYSPGSEPQVCQDAHSTVVAYSSISDFISNTFLLFLLAPLVGRWSDAYGRRPFLILTFVFASMPVLVLFFNLNYGTSMYYYYPAQAVNGAFSSISICMAYVADLIMPEHRAATFGLILCSFSVGILVGPLGGGYIHPPLASILALAGLCFCVLYVVLFIPESSSLESRQKAQEIQNAEPLRMRGPWHGFVILARSSLSIKLTVTLMISGVVAEGMYELLMQYFQIKLNFGIKDMSHMFVLAGLCGMFTQLVLLRLILRYMGKRNMLLIGLFASVMQQTFLIFVWNKQVALFAICLGSIGNLSFPAVSSIKSLNVAQSEQGAVQGALQGARALAQGAGPLIFAGLFTLFSRSWSPFPYYPGAPFVFGTVLLVIAFIVAATINREQADKGLQPDPSTEPLLSQEIDEETGEHQDNPKTQGPFPEHYVLPHNDTAILMEITPENAAEVCPHIPDILPDIGSDVIDPSHPELIIPDVLLGTSHSEHWILRNAASSSQDSGD